MKKILAVLFSVLLLCTCGAIFTACGEPPHEHNFNIKVVEEDYLASEATCSSPAKYYYVCTCWEHGTETYEYGTALEHSYTNYIYNNDAECEVDGTETATCDNGCGESDTRIKEGSAFEHELDNSGFCINCDTSIYTEGILYDYSSDRTYVEVIGYEGTSTKINIAPTYNNLPVKSIYKECFMNANITEVIIPNSVVSIGSNAFSNCPIKQATIPAVACRYISNSALEKVIITSGESIESYAFSGCSSLISIEIPDSVTLIGEKAFYGCPDSLFNIQGYVKYIATENNEYFAVASVTTSILSTYTIKDETKIIIGGAFSDCVRLASIEIPENVTFIGSSAFKNCSTLTSIEIPDSVTSIGSSAFSSCSKLTSVTIPNSVTSIEQKTFYNCSSLTSMEIPNSVTSIGDEAFSGCRSLTSMEIPDNVTSISYRAFYNCDSLTSVTIGDRVTSIGYGAFYGCPIKQATIPAIACLYINNSALEEVVITSGDIIGDEAFYNCRSLTSVTIPNSVTSIGSYAFRECTSLTSIEIPDSVTSIGNSAFYYCSSLTSVTIGDSVTSIGDYAFYSCDSLTSVTFTDTSTWYKTSSYENWINKTGGSQMDVTNPTQTASHLRANYYYYYWYKL